MLAKDRLIVALDFPSAAAAQPSLDAMHDEVSTYKVGLELFTAAGADFVRSLIRSGKKVFLDLKFHDIPNTVAGAVRSASELRVDMLTVHASGGVRMMEAAAEAASKAAKPPLILAVTVLTSLAAEDLKKLDIRASAEDHVLSLARMAKAAGCGGIVASPQEAKMLRDEIHADFALVTPGIRPAGADKGDQSRIATPAAAIVAGASHLVVGRPITQAPDPRAAARAILSEMESALATRV